MVNVCFAGSNLGAMSAEHLAPQGRVLDRRQHGARCPTKPREGGVGNVLNNYRELAMPHFGPELVEVMRNALEEVMTRVPPQYSNPTTKTYLAQCILKTAAHGQIRQNELVAAAAEQIQAAIALVT
jgi:hypothetical protein